MRSQVAFAALLLCAAVVGCSPTPPTQWEEEVRLSDGRVLRVRRIQEWEVRRPLGDPKHFLPLATRLSIQEVPVKEWSGYAESPLILEWDEQAQEFLLLVVPATCERYAQVGKPRPPYIEYRYRDSAWKRSSFSRSLVGRKPNLLVYPTWGPELSFVTLSDKEARNAQIYTFAEFEIRGDRGLGPC